MNLEQKIKAAIAYKGLNQAKVASMIVSKGKPLAPNNFNNKLKRGSFSIDELEQIAKALNAKFIYVYRFEFPDGTKI